MSASFIDLCVTSTPPNISVWWDGSVANLARCSHISSLMPILPDARRRTEVRTSGYHFAIRGPSTCFPIAGVSKRQTCVSHSIPEAEIVSADSSLRHCGLPSFVLWWTLLPQKPRLMFHGDNQTIRVAEIGRNPTMHYLARTRRVSVAWLHETFSQQNISLMYEVSSKMCADIFTKAFTEATKWQAVCDLINIVDPRRFKQFLNNFGTDEDKDDNVDCSVSAAPETLAVSSPFAPDQLRYDNTAHETRGSLPPDRSFQLILDYDDRTNGVFKKPLQRGAITTIPSLFPVTI